jgi:hypothetical protein
MMNHSVQPTWAAELLKNVDLDAISDDIRRFEQDDRWLQANIGLFRKDFPGIFVAVYNKRVIGAGKTLQEAQNKASSAGIDPARCVIQLVLAEDYIWVL